MSLFGLFSRPRKAPPRTIEASVVPVSEAVPVGEEKSKKPKKRKPLISAEFAFKILVGGFSPDKTEKSDPTSERFDRADVLSGVARVSQLPALNSIAESLRTSLADEDADLGEVAQTIEKDPAMASTVVKVSNSALIRGNEQIVSVSDAVARLGLREVRRLTAFTRILDETAGLGPYFDWRSLWMHSVSTGMIAEGLADALGLGQRPILNVAGLIHDVGKVILSELYPEPYVKVLVSAYRQSLPISDLERQVFGVTHEEVGALYLTQQGCTHALVNIVRNHDQPELSGDLGTDVALVQVANYLAKLYGLGFSGDRTFVEREVSDLAGWHLLKKSVGEDAPVVNDPDAFDAAIDGSLVRVRMALATWFPAAQAAV